MELGARTPVWLARSAFGGEVHSVTKLRQLVVGQVATNLQVAAPGFSVASLREALDAALSGTHPAVTDTPPVGCFVKWRPN